MIKYMAVGLMWLLPAALGSTGCALLPGGNLGNGPFTISQTGARISPLQNDMVHLTVSPGGASVGLDRIYVRVARGNDIVLKESYVWNYQQGVEADLGSSAAPLHSGDKVQVGTSEMNTYVELSVSP